MMNSAESDKTDALPACLEVRGISCERSERLLFTDLSFSLSLGKALLIEGSNGSGKTSLLRLLCGLGRPETGQILWRGRSIWNEREEYLRHMAYFGHLPAIKYELSALENIQLFQQLSGARSMSTPHQSLSKLGLEGFEDIPCQYLSAGQRRRVALARLYVTHYSLWILDEPLTALDVQGVRLVESMLEAHLGAGGAAIITTHQPVNLPGDRVQYLTLSKKHALQSRPL